MPRSHVRVVLGQPKIDNRFLACVKGEKSLEPKINVYVCQFNCLTVTVDVDEGVTPFMIQCRSRSTKGRPIEKKLLDEHGFCVGTAQSSFYPTGPKPSRIGDPKWEWYIPETNKGLSVGEAEHVKKGGLLLRPRTEREPVYHKEKTTMTDQKRT
jgi:hypothetical protein